MKPREHLKTQNGIFHWEFGKLTIPIRNAYCSHWEIGVLKKEHFV